MCIHEVETLRTSTGLSRLTRLLVLLLTKYVDKKCKSKSRDSEVVGFPNYNGIDYLLEVGHGMDERIDEDPKAVNDSNPSTNF